jgi:DNA-binding XRE family transcriptional regulator
METYRRTYPMTPQQLVAARSALNLSRRDLASVLGVHWNTVTKWETGGQGIPPYLGLALDGIKFQRMRAFYVEVKQPDSEEWIDVTDQVRSITLPSDSPDDNGTLPNKASAGPRVSKSRSAPTPDS